MKTKFLLLLVLVLMIPLIGKAQKTHTMNEDGVFSVVDKAPVYPGGEDSLRVFVARSVVYPDDAKKEKISGKVYVSFVVDEKGKVINARIARGVSPSLDKEALRVVNSMATWAPGEEDGKTVKVEFTMPIAFKLK